MKDKEKNKYEIVFTNEIYSSIHYDLDFYLHNHKYCELNSELYGVLREYVSENIDSFLGYVFYNSYGLAVVTFLDKKPDTCIEHFKNNSVSMEINCASFAILYALICIRNGNTQIVEVFSEYLRRELVEMEKRVGWKGLLDKIQKWIDAQAKQNLSFLPVGLELTLDELGINNNGLYHDYFLNEYPIENVTIKLIEHILRTANTIEEQLEAYKLIEANLKNISEKKRINLPVGWYNKIERGYFGNYLTLGATYCRVEKVPTEDEYIKLTKKKICLPPEFQTEEAMVVLNKLKNANLLTKDYMPMPTMSLTEKAILAGMISQELWKGKNHWNPFQTYWGVNNLSTLYSRGMNQKKSEKFIEQIIKALKK